MATLNDYLAPTLLRTADPKAELKRGKDFSVKARKTDSKHIWSYEFGFVGGYATVTDLKCYSSNHGHAMPVCEEILWHDVEVMVQGFQFVLPLTREFMIGSYATEQGEIKDNSSHDFWRLAAKLDRAFQVVFGYELSGDQVTPIDDVLLTAATFDKLFSARPLGPEAPPEPCEDPWAGDPSLSCGRGAEVFVDTTRILVSISLVCNKPRADFEPAEVLTAARFYPLVMAVASHHVNRLFAPITLKRPAKAMKMSKDMTEDFAVGLFTDRNSDDMAWHSPYPLWNRIFDYYDVAPAAGTRFEAVRISSVNADKLVDNQNSGSNELYLNPPAGGNKLVVIAKARTVKKVPYQGEFDNIHIAPYMLFGKAKEKIVMAPVCQHDCLHVHWRWSKAFTAKQNKGWSRAGVPYAEAGAPLVPPNQRVFVELTTDRPGLRYEALVRDLEAGQFQVVMHHGAGYALDVIDEFMTSKKKWGQEMMRNNIEGSWARFYRVLRYLDYSGLFDKIVGFGQRSFEEATGQEKIDDDIEKHIVEHWDENTRTPWKKGAHVERLYFRSLSALRKLGSS